MRCFSCRIVVNSSISFGDGVGNDTCSPCYLKYLDRRDTADVTFEQWRSDQVELFGFNPYMERELEIALTAPDAHALLPVSADVFQMIEEASARSGVDEEEVVHSALAMFMSHLSDLEADVVRMRTQAALISEAVAAAIRDGSDG
tara:strand:+ start:447 stop:881 length:435 start_codon:yes stop_codon:yes gene_type:complete